MAGNLAELLNRRGIVSFRGSVAFGRDCSVLAVQARKVSQFLQLAVLVCPLPKLPRFAQMQTAVLRLPGTGNQLADPVAQATGSVPTRVPGNRHSPGKESCAEQVLVS